MKIKLSGVVAFCGNYGSGKTETALNLAVHARKQGTDVRLADLDLINPYFRSREARFKFKSLGIQLILPELKFIHADLPILSPAVAGAIRETDGLTIIDAGGNDTGVTVLSSLNPILSQYPCQLFQVINPFRPATQSLQGCKQIRDMIEAVSRLKIAGIVGNPHMMEETVPEHIYEGYDFLEAVSSATGLEIKFITIPSTLWDEIDFKRFQRPVLLLKRMLGNLVLPWEQKTQERRIGDGLSTPDRRGTM